MVILQYPHVLTGKITSNGVKDADGDWQPGTETTFELKCRARPGTDTSGYINNKDGVKIDYNWTVYLPNPAPNIQIGTTVTVSNSEGVFLKDTVKRFIKEQLHSRLWL